MISKGPELRQNGSMVGKIPPQWEHDRAEPADADIVQTARVTSPEAMRLERWTYWIALLLVSALGGFLRLFDLGHASLYVDEFFTIARCGQEALDPIRALGYLPSRFSLWLAGAELQSVSLSNIASWQALGVTEASARLGPAVVGTLTIPAVAIASRSFLGARAAIYLAVLLAILPWHLFWSQNARFYSLQFMLFATGFCLLCAAFQSRSFRSMLLAMVLMILSHLAHPITILTVGGACGVAVVLAFLRRRDPAMRRIGWTAVLGAMIATGVGGYSLFGTPADLASFSEQTWCSGPVELMISLGRRIEPPLVVAAGVLVLTAIFARSARALPTPTVWLCTGAVIAPIVGLTLIHSEFPVAPRYLFCSLIAWLILAVIAIDTCERTVAQSIHPMLAALVPLSIAVSIGWNTRAYLTDGWRAPWRQVAEHIRKYRLPGEPLYTDSLFHVGYYTQDSHVLSNTDLADGDFWVAAEPPAFEHAVGDSRYECGRDFIMESRPWQPAVRVGRVLRGSDRFE